MAEFRLDAIDAANFQTQENSQNLSFSDFLFLSVKWSYLAPILFSKRKFPLRLSFSLSRRLQLLSLHASIFPLSTFSPRTHKNEMNKYQMASRGLMPCRRDFSIWQCFAFFIV